MGEVKDQCHVVYPVFNRCTSFSFHVNRTNFSWDMSNNVWSWKAHPKFLGKNHQKVVSNRISLKSNQAISMTEGWGWGWYSYRQMGELWTLFEFAFLQHDTRNMAVEMDGNILRVLFCSTIFSKLNLNGIKFGKIKRKNAADQSYPCLWGNFGHPGETLDGRLLCTSCSVGSITHEKIRSRYMGFIQPTVKFLI